MLTRVKEESVFCHDGERALCVLSWERERESGFRSRRATLFHDAVQQYNQPPPRPDQCSFFAYLVVNTRAKGGKYETKNMVDIGWMH